VIRFPDREQHQIFVEPEGLDTYELYPNGISTSLPFDAQMDLIRSIEGFSNTHITKPGYAIEYDYFNPQDLKYSLETKAVQGLFFAGQINGTTGYEEAAAQGLLAGANAALQVQGKDSWSLGRHEAYIGVLVDDLINMGTSEPYRMFTSRAEHRLLLRQDNADLRLTEMGRKLGLVQEGRWRAFCDKRESMELERQRLQSTFVQPNSTEASQLEKHTENKLSHEYSLLDLLKRPELNHEIISGLNSTHSVAKEVMEQIETEAKYAGYIDRQNDEIKRLQRHENTAIPDQFNYEEICGLSNEVKQKLSQVRPDTIARASRISGVTPAAVSLLLVSLKKYATQG
jgi:tRNA uridine 5-carboxymethylaminomethyl modification enzyme